MPSPDNLAVDVTIGSDVMLPATVSEDALASLTAHVLSSEGKSGAWQLGIRFLDDAAMQRAHAEFMGIDTPTDIMTFPYEEDEFDLEVHGEEDRVEQGGDLMISVDRAAEHAAEAEWSTEDELHFLVIHGILHILGWDDASENERARMLTRQSELLQSWRGGS